MAADRYRPIALIGPYPGYGGDVGGISTHLRRLRALLLQENFDVRVYQLAGHGCPDEQIYPVSGHLRPVTCQLLAANDAVVHSHIVAPHHRVAQGWLNLLRRGPLLMTVHGRNLKMQMDKSALVRTLLGPALRRYDHLIGVGPEVADDIRKLVGPKKSVTVLPAFVPPVPNQPDRDRMPEGFKELVRTHKPIFAANGSVSLYGEKDLYGFDLAYELLRRLRKRHPDAGLVISLTNRSNEDPKLWAAIEGGANAPDLKGHVWINQPGYEFWPVLEEADVFLRPTRIDGWGVSVAEAILLGTPAVASDVCARVSGAYIFASEDLEDFERATERALAEGVPAGAGKEVDYHLRLLDLYRELARR